MIPHGSLSREGYEQEQVHDAQAITKAFTQDECPEQIRYGSQRGQTVNKEWLITLEGRCYMKKGVCSSWTSAQFYKTSDLDYIAYMSWRGKDKSSESMVLVYKTKKDLVDAVLEALRASFRVKEMPHKHGFFWRELFNREGIANWANEAQADEMMVESPEGRHYIYQKSFLPEKQAE